MEKRIKILYGLEAASGGALKHLIYLTTHLDKNIFDITVILSPRLRDAELEIDKLKAIGIKIIEISMCREVSLVKDCISLCKIIRFLHVHTFDIVHSHSSKAGVYFRVAAWINKVPLIVYTPHCFYFQSKSGMSKTIFELLERFLGFITDRIIVSENEKNECVNSKIVPFTKLLNINNAINFNDYTEHDKVVALATLGLQEDAIVIGAIGRLVKQKNFLTLINAANELVKSTSNLYFVIAGSGELYDSLQSKINDYGLEEKVLLIGHQTEISKIYSAIDIFVSTSLWEGLPYVMLEAMWYRKPIITTDLKYGENFTETECLVQPGDTFSLCKKLDILIKDKGLCESIGRRNRITAQSKFSFKEFIRLHEELYLKKI